ncbi:MAG: cbb3-type cytochrome c oxidase subunit I [Proteobacteria bacterium]|jgi:cbb3-type cytochrome oxidase subunit 1|nr:cbb3-type cytochrome c oxidase subunit I [Pseudomonadota bacterium]
MLAEKFIKSSVVYVILGMIIGIYMAASQDHSQSPTHAHMNLLGWVTMALMGLVYKNWPEVAAAKLANLTFWLAHVTVIGLSVGIGGLYAGYPEFEPVAIIASFVAVGNMLLFAFLFFRNS